jgi:hypothetical protein
MSMSQITVRNVDAPLKALIVRSAKLKGMSINEWTLEAIRARVGLNMPIVSEEPSWKQFVGCLPADAINMDAIEEMDQIDPKMWDPSL